MFAANHNDGKMMKFCHNIKTQALLFCIGIVMLHTSTKGFGLGFTTLQYKFHPLLYPCPVNILVRASEADITQMLSKIL